MPGRFEPKTACGKRFQALCRIRHSIFRAVTSRNSTTRNTRGGPAYWVRSLAGGEGAGAPGTGEIQELPRVTPLGESLYKKCTVLHNQADYGPPGTPRRAAGSGIGGPALQS